MTDKLNAEWLWAVSDQARYSREHFHLSFTVIMAIAILENYSCCTKYAVFKGEEEGSVHIGGIRKRVKLTSHVITFAMINSDS